MRIHRSDGSDLPHVAVFDEADTRALSRSAEALPAWLRERILPGDASLHLVESPARSLIASFADEAVLHAFIGGFLPGKVARGVNPNTH